MQGIEIYKKYFFVKFGDSDIMRPQNIIDECVYT